MNKTMAELLTFVLGDVFGILTLVVGIVIGFGLGRLWSSLRSNGEKSTEEGDDKSSTFREQVAGMIQFTNHFSGDLTKHIELLESLGQKLSTPADAAPIDDEARSSKAVSLVAEIAAANHRLKTTAGIG